MPGRVILLGAAVLGLLAGCASPHPADTGTHQCSVGPFVVSGSFDGARLGECSVRLGEDVLRLSNHPEDEPINHSPWYAFRIEEGRGELQVQIDYALHRHRYVPKVSWDGRTWQPLAPERVRLLEDGRSVRLTLQVERTPMWISAQELLTEGWYAQWYRYLEETHGARITQIGRSVGGRPVTAVDVGNSAKPLIVLLGRAHPPEVTGALAMYAFVNRLLEAHSGFLSEYALFAVPLLNPDGVALGHWRHGLGGLDLNRDWGPFTQPETQAVVAALEARLQTGRQPVLMLDFHSTQKNLFYTQSEEEAESLGHFAERWLTEAKRRGAYPFGQERRHNEGRPTSKNYFFQRFGIPAITYEVGNETPRQPVLESARVFADALVAVLEAREDPPGR